MTQSCWDIKRPQVTGSIQQREKQAMPCHSGLSSVRRCLGEPDPAVTGKLEGMENRPEKRPPQGAGVENIQVSKT